MQIQGKDCMGKRRRALKMTDRWLPVNDNWNGAAEQYPPWEGKETSNPFRKKKKRKEKKANKTSASSAGVSGVTGSGSQLLWVWGTVHVCASELEMGMVVVAASYTSLQSHEATPLCLMYTRGFSCDWSSQTVQYMLALPSHLFHCLPLKFRTTFIHFIHSYIPTFFLLFFLFS